MILALALALTLTGCNLIGIDPKMQADEDIAKIEKRYAQTVATYDGGVITAGEAVGDFNDNYSQMYYMYAYYMGYQMTEEDVHGLIEGTLEDKVRSAVVEKRFDAEYTLTDEELAAAEETGAANFAELQEAALAETEGKTDAEKKENARVLIAQVGRGEEIMRTDAIRAAKVEKMENILRDAVTEVTDEELQAAYDAKVAEHEETYSANPAAYGTAMTNGSEIYWVPDGYRTVKHILFVPEGTVLTAYTDAVNALDAKKKEIAAFEDELASVQDDDIEGARTAEEIQADIDAANAELSALEAAAEAAGQACLDNVKEKTDEVYAKLAAGEAFDDLMAQYGEDPGMKSEPAMTTGYYVCKESTNWHQAFTDGAMALNQVGDYSAEPVLTASGVHIIEFASDVAGGAVELSTVADALREEELENRKNANRDDTINGWIEEAHPTYDVEAFEAALSE